MRGRFVVPEKVVSHFHIRAGDTVADFGAGSGYFVKVLAKAVGDDGLVHACEIQKNLVEAVGEQVRRDGLDNVEIHWCDVEEANGSKLPTDSLDIVLIVNSLFAFEDKPTALEEAKRVLRKGGRLIIIDWTESFGGLGPQPDQVIDAAAATNVAEQVGFTLERDFDAGDHHYGLSFRF